MKTIEEWLQELPVEYRDKALANLRPTNRYLRGHILSAAICEAFYWRESPEGSDFWGKVYNQILEQEQQQQSVSTKPKREHAKPVRKMLVIPELFI